MRLDAFNAACRWVLLLAVDHARLRNLSIVDAHSLLSGMMSLDDGIARRALVRSGVAPTPAEQSVLASYVGSPPPVPPAERTREVVEWSFDVAATLADLTKKADVSTIDTGNLVREFAARYPDLLESRSASVEVVLSSIGDLRAEGRP